MRREVVQTEPTGWLSVAATVLPLVGLPVIYSLIWSLKPLSDYIFDELDLLSFLAIFVLLAIVHELIHAACFIVFAGVSMRSISFTIHWRQLAPATFCHEVVPASAFRITTVAPLVLLGLLPAAFGLVTGSALVTFWSAFMLSAAAGDLAILHATRDLPSDHGMWVSPRPGPGVQADLAEAREQEHSSD
jgi:hypothetical protein